MEENVLPAGVKVLHQQAPQQIPVVGVVAGARALDIFGVYAEMVVHVENGRWGGILGNRLTIHPRPSRPVSVQVFTEGWKPVSQVGPELALAYALDQVSAQAVDWVERFVLSLAPESR